MVWRRNSGPIYKLVDTETNKTLEGGHEFMTGAIIEAIKMEDRDHADECM